MAKRVQSKRVAESDDGGAAAATERPDMNVDDWAALIKASWQKAVESIIETACHLAEAKAKLAHGEWGRMVEEKLRFGRSMADKLVKIAENAVLTNSEFIPKLPASWGTLYEMTKLPEEAIKGMLADGRIGPDTRKRDVVEIIEEVRGDGVYDFDRIREAARVLIKFMGKWPDVDAIAERTFDSMVEKGYELDLRSVAELPRWVGELVSACLSLDREENQTLVIQLVPTTEAELEQAARRRKREGRVPRPTFKSHSRGRQRRWN